MTWYPLDFSFVRACTWSAGVWLILTLIGWVREILSPSDSRRARAWYSISFCSFGLLWVIFTLAGAGERREARLEQEDWESKQTAQAAALSAQEATAADESAYQTWKKAVQTDAGLFPEANKKWQVRYCLEQRMGLEGEAWLQGKMSSVKGLSTKVGIQNTQLEADAKRLCGFEDIMLAGNEDYKQWLKDYPISRLNSRYTAEQQSLFQTYLDDHNYEQSIGRLTPPGSGVRDGVKEEP